MRSRTLIRTGSVVAGCILLVGTACLAQDDYDPVRDRYGGVLDDARQYDYPYLGDYSGYPDYDDYGWHDVTEYGYWDDGTRDDWFYDYYGFRVVPRPLPPAYWFHQGFDGFDEVPNLTLPWWAQERYLPRVPVARLPYRSDVPLWPIRDADGLYDLEDIDDLYGPDFDRVLDDWDIDPLDEWLEVNPYDTEELFDDRAGARYRVSFEPKAGERQTQHRDAPRSREKTTKHDHRALVPSITVTGTGSVRRPPDVALVTVGVVTQADTAGEAVDENNAAMQELIARLKERGINPRNIQTTSFDVSPQRDYDRDGERPPKIVGYQVTNLVQVRVEQLDELGSLLDEVVERGANRVDGISFTLADKDDALDAARQEAMDDAHRKAKLFADAAGARVGSVLLIQEEARIQPPQPYMVRGFQAQATAASVVPIQTGTQEYQAEVTVTWRLVTGKPNSRDRRNAGSRASETFPASSPSRSANNQHPNRL